MVNNMMDGEKNTYYVETTKEEMGILFGIKETSYRSMYNFIKQYLETFSLFGFSTDDAHTEILYNGKFFTFKVL